MCDKIQLSQPEVIASIFHDEKRPFWSVMIPTCGKSTFLEQTLRSVIVQVDNQKHFQIEIVENTAPDASSNVAEILLKLGSNPYISHYKNKTFLSMAENWNTCIKRSRGLYVHILHDDDYVEKSFYAEMEMMIKNSDKDYGLFSCNTYSIDQSANIISEWCYPNEIYKGKATVSLLAENNYFSAPSVVIKRECYEKLGGFCPNLRFVTDWEMWVRVANDFKFKALDRTLAYYRYHQTNLTNLLRLEGTDLTEAIYIIKQFQKRDIKFNWKAALRRRTEIAYRQYKFFKKNGELQTAKICHSIFIANTNYIEKFFIIAGISQFEQILKRISYYIENPLHIFKFLRKRIQAWKKNFMFQYYF